MIDTVNLPDDIDALKSLILASQEAIAEREDELLERDALIDRKQDRINHLETLVAAFKQALFGAKSEKTDPDQFELALEDIETAMAVVHAEDEADHSASRPAKPRKANRGSLPKHLPRIEEEIEPEELTCGCGAARHVIGEDVSERLDVIPDQFRVIVTRRPKYGCRSCEEGIVQAPAPTHLITGGIPNEATSVVAACDARSFFPLNM